MTRKEDSTWSPTQAVLFVPKVLTEGAEFLCVVKALLTGVLAFNG